ncbi:hypothetical protein [Saccharolobus sp. A20]|uniref:hypothetical protein n=1 Tax=Saccharolobus sp. A20 TaxID=1891280 RepID=UPI000A8C49DB|nr:hypothetical protein [Sulfolobus sp. A20]
MSFWEYYKMVEDGTLVKLEEFKRNQELKERVKQGILGMIKVLRDEISIVISYSSYEDAIWKLMKMNIISPLLAQELMDIYSLVENLDKIDDEILYGMLVRIMEDIEEAIISINRYKKEKRSLMS